MLFHTYAFLIKVFFLFFFPPWKFPVSSLVVFCSVSVACFSAPFNVLTGILLQLKQLYFTCLVLCLNAHSFLFASHFMPRLSRIIATPISWKRARVNEFLLEFYGWHGGTVIRTVAIQAKGPGFKFSLESFWGESECSHVCMGFPPQPKDSHIRLYTLNCC